MATDCERYVPLTDETNDIGKVLCQRECVKNSTRPCDVSLGELDMPHKRNIALVIGPRQYPVSTSLNSNPHRCCTQRQ